MRRGGPTLQPPCARWWAAGALPSSPLAAIVSRWPAPRRSTRTWAATLLTGVGRRDSEGLDWLDWLFARTDLAPGIKYAIADAVLDIDGRRREGRAAGLLALPGCPDDVADHIRNELRHCD
ncbi:hypothetical protein [Streptomyces pseudovenezuelae]|uniref:Uncharacterized protein n=1 Tax=Streptomyces pseudovenezuelae TaxID=67350 RepID=A0ABT6LFR7_9ACTN|nr:hypothetical protein [Streptomyces pseudovenezuelae]MDH6214199.1 hypothetical protein [Streptomyces pseudovenezuelae]